jgi:hypothetical protein
MLPPDIQQKQTKCIKKFFILFMYIPMFSYICVAFQGDGQTQVEEETLLAV